MSITFHPKIGELAKSREVAEQVNSASFDNWIISGLDLSIPVSGLDVPVSNGKAFINGYVVTIDSEDVTVADDDTSTIYLGANVDGNGNVTSFSFGTSVPSSGKYAILGQAVAASGDIVSVSDTNRYSESRQIFTSSIKDSAVTLDKIQNIETARVLGRISSGTGNVEELTSADLQSFISSTPSTRTVVKILDQGVANSTTLVDDNELTLSLGANTTYNFEAELYVNHGGGDIKYFIDLPVDCEDSLLINNSSISSGYTNSSHINNIIGYSFNIFNSSIIKSDTGLVFIRGMIKTISSGNLKIKFSQNVSNSNPAAIKAGSYIKLENTENMFIPSQSENIDVLVVGGGGSGGSSYYGPPASGGGGAGGYIYDSFFLPYADILTITIGAGGSNSSGSNSTLLSTAFNITANGGGRGASYNSGALSGGSGGGGANNSSGATGISGQGNGGGTGSAGNAGGGGGAGASGSSPNGGDGLSSDIEGSTKYYAGGGGAYYNGTGGLGGGGNGPLAIPGQPWTRSGGGGVANTGGGGGGAWEDFNTIRYGGGGGSGVIIIKYPNTLICNVGAGLTSTETTSGSYKIIKFTAGTGNINFTSY